MSATTPTVRSPADLLALFPYQFGFQPRESVVVAGVRNGRLGLVARADLSALAVRPDLARDMATRLLADGATAAFLVIYTAYDLQRQWENIPLEVEMALASLGEVPVSFADAWVVGPHGFYHLDCPLECCPAGGHDLDELNDSAMSAAMVYAGRRILPSRDALIDIEPADRLARKRAYRSYARWRHHPLREQDELRWRETLVAVWLKLIESADPPSAVDLGKVLAGFSDPVIGDALVVSLVTQLRPYVVETCAREVASFHEAVDAILAEQSSVKPDFHHIQRCDQVLVAALAHAPRMDVSGAWALRSLIHWWRGDGAMGQLCAEQVLKAHPRHLLAELVYQLSATGRPPGWVHSRS